LLILCMQHGANLRMDINFFPNNDKYDITVFGKRFFQQYGSAINTS
jgi:hypothetical protein